MLSFRINSVRVELCFGFFLVVALASVGNSDIVAVSLLCCILHEAGHLVAMYYYGRKPNAICFYGGGVKIKAPALRLDYKHETIIYSAGCAVNLFLFLLSSCAGKGDTDFAQANLLLCGFNLLPFRQLDGGRLTQVLDDSSAAWHSAFIVVRAFAAIVLLLAVIKALITGNISFTLIVATIYIVVSECHV